MDKTNFVKELSKQPSNNWHIQDIKSRDVLLFNEICNALEKWRNEYDQMIENSKPIDGPTEEEKKRYEEWKKRGLL